MRYLRAVRWLYHLVRKGDSVPSEGGYAPPSLDHEGFVHCSYRDDVLESARLYFAGEQPRVFRIDPRRLLGVRVVDEPTPRGPMPHVFGPIPRDAIREVHDLTGFVTCDGEPPTAPDRIDA